MSICPDIDTIKLPCIYYLKSPNGEGFCSRNDRFRCIEYIVQHNPVISMSSISTFNQCLRKFYYTYMQGYQSKLQNLKAVNGIIFHAYVSGMHTNEKKYTERARKLYQKMEKEIIETHGIKNWQMSELLKIKPSVAAYHYHEFLKIGGKTEVEKLINYNDQYQLKTIVDLKVKNLQKLYAWKYTNNPDFYTIFTTEDQVGLYLASYPNYKSITFLLIRVPDAKRAGNETNQEFQERLEQDMCRRKDYYFIEKTFHRAEYDIERIMYELTFTADEIVYALGKPIYYWRQDKKACWQFGKFCDFYQCCESRVTPDMLPNLYQKRDIDNVIYDVK